MRALGRRRVYLRLIDDPPVAAAGVSQLDRVRRAVEGVASVRREEGYPKVDGRGGRDAVFSVDDPLDDPLDDATLDRRPAHLRRDGYRPCS